MQETFGRFVGVERGVHRICGQHAGQRQITTGNAFGQANEVWTYVCLLTREHRPGAAKSDGDFIRDQMHAILRTQLSCPGEISRVVHGHARRALYQGFKYEGGDFVRVLLQMTFQCIGAAGMWVMTPNHYRGQPEIRRRHLRRLPQQRCVLILE